MQIQHHTILNFWFGQWPFNHNAANQQSTLWFMSTPEHDLEIERQFSHQIEAALNQVLMYSNSIEERVAFILLTDQFTRNIYRKTAKAFSGDALALQQSLALINEGLHLTLPIAVAAFACMPLQHSESKAIQKQSLQVFNDLATHAHTHDLKLAKRYAEYAQVHADLIFQFGRFPHRNDVLNRLSSAEEIHYLAQSPLRFGQ